MTDTTGYRRPTEDDRCTCGQPATVVYVFPNDDDSVREVPYCGVPHGGDR